MRRNVEALVRRVREELRAEGVDGAGYSDFIIVDGINSALDDLSEVFTIRDVVTFTTIEGQNEYNLKQVVSSEIYHIIKVTYDGEETFGRQLDSYMDVPDPEEGAVRTWFLWGSHLTFVGDVEADKEVKLWITRAPEHISADNTDWVPETPSMADEALVAYTISVCYRESKDYERANYHYRIYLRQKDSLMKRAVPQGQRDFNPNMRATYWGPFRPRRGTWWDSLRSRW